MYGKYKTMQECITAIQLLQSNMECIYRFTFEDIISSLQKETECYQQTIRDLVKENETLRQKIGELEESSGSRNHI